jgi:hypothetical protein
MILSQEFLRAEVARRVRAARSEPGGEVTAFCVLHRFEPAGFIRGVCAFAASLTSTERARWRRSFTRTIFLAGNPRHVTGRFAFRHVAEDATAAWIGPAEPEALLGLRRLLKLFDAPGAVPAHPELAVVVPGAPDGPGTHRRMLLATADSSLSDHLVQLHHLVAEAVIDTVIQPGDRLTVRQVPRLPGTAGPFAALRIRAGATPDTWDARAALTKELTHA